MKIILPAIIAGLIVIAMSPGALAKGPNNVAISIQTSLSFTCNYSPDLANLLIELEDGSKSAFSKKLALLVNRDRCSIIDECESMEHSLMRSSSLNDFMNGQNSKAMSIYNVENARHCNWF